MGFETGAGEFMQAGSYSAAQLRRSVFAWAARTSANIEGEIVGGLLSATDMQLSAAGSGLVVNTSTGACLIPGTEATSQGGYHAFLSSTNSTKLATADATNPRVDLLCATSADAQYTTPPGGTSGFVTIQAVTGIPTAGANLTNLSGAPSLPGSSLLLGYVLVPAGATSLSSGDIANKARIVGTLPMFGTVGEISGTMPPTNMARIQVGAENATFSSGIYTLTFPVPFVDALLGVWFTYTSTSSTQNVSLSVDTSNYGQNGCSVGAVVAGAAFSGTLGFQWLAIGY